MSWSTLEVRWFFPGPLEPNGAAVATWFCSRPRYGGGEPLPLVWEPAPPAWRQDRYLVIPGHGDMGIKWREGRLEIKGRKAALGHRVFAPGIEGRCERWIKWSYAGAAIERRFLRLFQDAAGQVALVEKRRLQRMLSINAAGSATEPGSTRPRERGVNVELAQVRMPGSRVESHWSLAFEAFPGDAQAPEQFAQLVARFLENCPALPLMADRSMSYPRWLRDFDQSAESSG